MTNEEMDQLAAEIAELAGPYYTEENVSLDLTSQGYISNIEVSYNVEIAGKHAATMKEALMNLKKIVEDKRIHSQER